MDTTTTQIPAGSTTSRDDMERAIRIHFNAETTHDIDAVLETETADAVNDAPGFPGNPFRGLDAIRNLYTGIFADLELGEMRTRYRWYGDDFAVDDSDVDATVNGSFMGFEGRGRRISFRIHHVFRFRDGKICYENVWIDGASVAQQLGGP